MSERKSPAERSQKAPRSRKGQKPSAAQKAAGVANLEAGRKKREQMKQEAAEEGRDSATVRWAKLIDGTLTVEDLDNEELARMQMRGVDGSFTGRKRAIPSHLAHAMQREGVKRANAMFHTAAPRAVKRLLEIADDPDVSENVQVQALKIVLERSLGKMPETIMFQEADKWDAMLNDGLSTGGVDRTFAEDDPR